MIPRVVVVQIALHDLFSKCLQFELYQPVLPNSYLVFPILSTAWCESTGRGNNNARRREAGYSLALSNALASRSSPTFHLHNMSTSAGKPLHLPYMRASLPP
jgi:hypothetical protein